MTEGRIVGRSNELATITKIIERASDREVGGLTLVKGAAGIGKTRLLEELATDASAGGVAAIWVHCSNDDGVPELWPWVQLLRKMATDAEVARIGKSHPASVHRIAEHFPEFGHWKADNPTRGSIDPSTERFLLHDAIRTVVVEAANSKPLLVLMEDLQWADESSVSVLEMLLESPGQEGIEFVVSIRDSVLSDDRYVPPQTLTRSPNYAGVVLENLDKKDSELLFNALLGDFADVPPESDVWTITGGNPLFIREYANSWIRGTTSGEASIPSTAVETIESRIQAVTPEKLAILEYGAVLGNEFDFARLAASMGSPNRHTLAARIGSGIELGFIEERVESPGWFKFTHEVIRRVIYDRMPNARRASIHREVAEALEKLPGDSTTGYAAEISAHWQRAGVYGDIERATHWSLRAGQDALSSYSFEQAREHFERARLAAHQIDDEYLQASADAGAGESLAPLGREEEAVALLKSAFDYFVEFGKSDEAIRIALVNFTGTYGQLEMIPVYERALVLLDSDSTSAARIQSHLARAVAIEMGDFKRGRSLLKSAIRIARKANDKTVESMAAGYGVQIAAFAAEWHECITYCEQVLDLQGAVDDPYSVSTAGMLLSGFRVKEGRHKESDALISRARRSAERTGNKLRIISCDLLELRISHARCQWERVKSVIDRTDEEYSGAERVIAMSALCHHLLGEADQGDAALQRFLASSQETGESPDAQYFPYLARSTRDAEHVAIVKAAAKVAERSRAEYVRRRGAIARGWMAVEENDTDTAQEVLEDLDSLELLHDEEPLRPALELLCGNVEQAASAFEALIESQRESGIHLFEAWTRFDFARLLSSHPTVRPKIVPQKYATESRLLASKHGLDPLVARFDELLSEMGVERTPFDLTKREVEVLGLVAQGSTNKEIADQLFVSPHTVNRHLGNLFNKLGVSSRAAATDLAHQRNIV